MRGEGEGKLYHIRLFRLDSGGPPQMEEKDSVTEHIRNVAGLHDT